MKTLLAFLAILLCCSQVQAQNVEGQIVASQFGQFQVPGISTGSLVFEPATCQVSGGGKNFTAFAVGVPVKIVDANPSLNEIDTPTAVFPSQCAISMTTSHLHTVPFYVTSGTGGLQEAITNGPVKGGGPNTIILNADWYLQVLPGNPASVIAAVKGNTSMGLVDVTTSPYTYYQWNGSQYAAVSASGLPPASAAGEVPTSTGAGTNYVATTSPSLPIASGAGQTIVSSGAGTAYTATLLPTFPSAGIVNATSPNTSTAATSTQIATALNISPTTPLVTALIPQATTSAFGTVKPDNSSITISGGVISATPTPLPTASATGQPLVSVAPGNTYVAGNAVNLATGSTAVTQSPGDNTTKVATDAFVLANGSGGTPGGSNTQVQFNNSGSFGGDSTFTFDNSGKTLGFQNGTIAPLGTAVLGTNVNSGILQTCASYWDGSAAAPDCWLFQNIPLTGTNPYSILTVTHSGSPQGGQINFPFSQFQVGFALNAGNGSNIIQFKGPANLPSAYSLFWPASAPTAGNTLLDCSPGSSSVCTWSAGSGGGIAVTPQQFGGFGDAFSPPDGFSTTASSTTVSCPDGCFQSGDAGKQVWVQGAGTSGHAFNATITAFVSNTTVTVSAAATATVSNAHGVYGHDDTTAIQSCLQYSAINSAQCFAVPAAAPSGQSGLIGFLVNGSLQLVSNNALEENSGPNLVGSSQSSGTNFFCENNGDCLNLASGPIQGASVSNIDFQEDPTQPNSRGIHLNPQVGTFGNGPFTNSNFYNVNVDNPAKECLWMDGGGGVGYAFNLPNQYVQFTQFWCNGPNQSHPANLILMTGQAAQIIFTNGQVNGQAWSGGSSSLYPNPLIKITEKTSGLGDTPVDVKFYGYTFEVGTQGLYIGNGANNIHFDNSYVENVSTPFIVTGAVANTFDGDHIANSGNITGVYQFSSNSGASVRDNLVYGGVAPNAALAVCSSPPNQLVFDNNNIGSGSGATTNCATSTESTGGGSLTIAGSTSSVTATGSFNTINAGGVSPGKTLTMYTAGGMQLTSGGNIAFGNYTAPLTIPAGGSVTLTLMDAGVTWLITDGPPPNVSAPNWSSIVHGTNTDTGNFSTNGNWFYHQSAYFDSNSGTQFFSFGPSTSCSGNCTNIFDDNNFHIDGTSNGARELIFSGNSGGNIAIFTTGSGALFTVKNDGSLITPKVTSVLGSEESVFSSSTPTFSTAVRESTTVLTANITTFTLATGAAGQEKTLTFCQNATGGFTVTPPSNVHGFFTVGTTASKCSSQHFTYNSVQAEWLADSAGVVNE